MDLKDFDPHLTYTSFDEHMQKATNPKQLAHLKTVIRHSRGEVHADLSEVMPTLSDNPQYHEFGVFANTLEDTGPKGMAAVQKNYEGMVANGSYVIESKKDRVVCSDDEIVTAGTFRQILNAETAKTMGFVPKSSNESDYYMLSARTIVFWTFDKDGKACGEDRFVMNHKIVPLAEKDLPPNYPQHLRKTTRVEALT